MTIVTLMLAWSVTATTFQTLLALGVLAGVVCVVIVGVAAFVFPMRRPDLFNSSPANLRVLGIPVLQICAPLSVAVVLFLTWETWHYYIARAVRRSQGIDLDLVYKELPPD
jgi:hypothetical protein